MILKALVTAAALLVATAGSAAAAGDPIMPLEEVVAGQQCHGYSVIRGTQISSFDVEVVDVIDSLPGSPGARILVRASGPAVDTTGIGPGFSGSPIVCTGADGVARTIGAISESIGDYGGKLVLATPIESILASSVAPPRPGARRDRGVQATRALMRIRAEGVRALSAPLTVGGLSPQLSRALERAGRRVGRSVITVPAGPLSRFPPQTLRPGAAVAVGLSDGDLRLGAVGTVAYVDGDRVWAFGHPMDAVGARSLLLQDAYVYGVVNEPNAAQTGGSYKLAVPGHVVGTLTGDSMSAVVGVAGSAPATFPVRVIAEDLDVKRTHVLETEVADETDVGTPTGTSPLGAIAPLAVAQATVTALSGSPGRLTGRMCLRITFRERPLRPARFCNRYVTSELDPLGGPLGSAVALESSNDAAEAVRLIDAYRGPAAHVQAVEAHVEVHRGRSLAVLDGVRAASPIVRGRTARLRVALRLVGGRRVTRTVRVPISRSTRPGPARLVLEGAEKPPQAGGFLELVLGVGAPGPKEGGGPATLAQLTRAIERLGRRDGAQIRLGGQVVRELRSDDYVIEGKVSTRVLVDRAR